ncbi:MFS transporter [Rubricoccus marinus]|uniref:MFS transporter n=1 Tax=Rubricoccus marinus TaxID=716817 RepID=A0A259TX84_9BACT|nr:MFS transporter [Rubricoccus marinus]OZC02379.1 MFS transporter [Rubricoccus marinus]
MARPPASQTAQIRSWALYDFANSAFTTLVITFIYATFFVKGVAPDETTGTTLWSLGVVTPTAILVALLSPLLGAMADRTGTRKRALFITTVICVGTTALLFFPQRGDVWMAIVLVVIANVAFEVGQVFYNAFLPEIAPEDKIGRISGWAWALGYAGGLLCMALALALVMPEVAPFGLDKDTGEHVRVTNLLVAGWFALFSIPAFLYLREPKAEAAPSERGLIATTFGELKNTFVEIRRYRQVIRLLLARLFYNDGLVTVFAMGGIFAATAYGFSESDILLFGIVLNVAAGIGAFSFGFVDDKLGGKTTIFISLGILCVATLIAVLGPSRAWLWGAGVLIGVASGPNQAASRSLLGRFVPHDKETEFYGFFAFSGKATAFIGPVLFGVLTAAFGTPRAGIAAVLGLFAIGAFFLLRVNEQEGAALRVASASPQATPAL